MKKIRLDERERQRRRRTRVRKMLNIPLLRVLRADLHDLLAVLDRSLGGAVELDVRLDELDRAIGAGRHRLRRAPVNQ